MATIKNTHRILVAPLDWGLGHTTRCVPVIQHIIAAGHDVIFAGNDWQRRYITDTFPGIDTIHLDGYNVHYASSGSMFMAAIGRQVPGILKTVKKEHNWLKDVVKTHSISAVISDNRYGLYHDGIPSVIMTHQLNAMSGMGSLADAMVRKLHYRRLEKFNHCWVVDVREQPGLAGKLSHPHTLPRNCEYIGLLSQAAPVEHTGPKHLLVLLSGPEPQRGMLSQKLWEQLQPYNGPIVFTEGKADANIPVAIPPHIQHHAILTKDKLREAIQGASMVICRSGYSTVMDLVKLQKKAIFIPTPGQTEQEYLAKQLDEQGMFSYMPQNSFDLQTALHLSGGFPYRQTIPAEAFNMYKQAVSNFLQAIQSEQ